jgi:hypothetical protein
MAADSPAASEAQLVIYFRTSRIGRKFDATDRKTMSHLPLAFLLLGALAPLYTLAGMWDRRGKNSRLRRIVSRRSRTAGVVAGATADDLNPHGTYSSRLK